MGVDYTSFHLNEKRVRLYLPRPFLFPFFEKIFSARHRNKRSPVPFCMVYNARPSRDAFIHCKSKKGETLMKNALVRILTIATLATSISAFAADEPKSNETAVASANTQQEGCAGVAHKEKKPKKAKSQRDDDRTQQEKEFDHVLMGIYG
jgi:hypothetical protein